MHECNQPNSNKKYTWVHTKCSNMKPLDYQKKKKRKKSATWEYQFGSRMLAKINSVCFAILGPLLWRQTLVMPGRVIKVKHYIIALNVKEIMAGSLQPQLVHCTQLWLQQN